MGRGKRLDTPRRRAAISPAGGKVDPVAVELESFDAVIAMHNAAYTV